MGDDPTPGELGRAVSNLSAQLGELNTRLVRADVYEAHRAAMQADLQRLERRLDEVERDLEQHAARADASEKDRVRERGEWRRWFWGVVIACLVTAFATVAGEAIVKVVLQ